MLALQHIQSQQFDKIVTVKEIAEKNQIPQPLLAKILQQLAKKQIIKSIQGVKGGYVLGAKAEKISLAHVLEAIEGPIHITDCYDTAICCSRHSFCTLKDKLNPIQQQLVQYLSKITLLDFQKSQKQNSGELLNE